MTKPAVARWLRPGTPAYRFALWLGENPRKWLTWMALGAGALALMSIAFAAVWAAWLPQWQSTTSVWVWGVTAAIYFAVSAGLLVINATGHMPGWLAAVLAIGGLFSAMGVLVVFFWAVLATDSSSLLAVAAIAASLVVVIPLTFALIWPLAEATRPGIARQQGEDDTPGSVRQD